MTTLLQSLDELLDWEGYRTFLKTQLKALADGDPVYVSKDKVEFTLNGKPWSGCALLVGGKGTLAAQKLRKQGVAFRDGVCRLDGTTLRLEGLNEKLVAQAAKTLKKLVLGYAIRVANEEAVADEDVAADAEEDVAAAEPPVEGERSAPASDALARQAARIDKAVNVWRVTEQVAKKSLRKLQKEILSLGDPSTTPVIQGLERILTRLDKVDDEAREATEAAARGDQPGFERAREDLVQKLGRIREYVQNDELIRDADQNPAVETKLAATITTSIDRLLAAV